MELNVSIGVDGKVSGRDNGQMFVVDIIALFLLRSFVMILNALPLTVREKLFGFILRALLIFFPSYRRIAFKNLELVLPAMSREQHELIYQESIKAFGRIFIDFARIDTLDQEWVRTHVEFPNLLEYERITRDHPDTGIVLATGHLGSFEILAHALAFYSRPLSFVARSFSLPRVNEWWRRKREVLTSNHTIDRRGAVKDVFADLSRGRDVGILFDHNIKRNHAVFVPFFGRQAATTKLVGLAALKVRAPVVAVSIAYLGSDRYRINAVEVPCQDVFDDRSRTTDEKVRVITERVSVEYEKMIRQYPGEWFWFHRRWKTTPEGVSEDFY